VSASRGVPCCPVIGCYPSIIKTQGTSSRIEDVFDALQADFLCPVPDPRLTTDHFVGKVSAVGQPTRPTQPSIPPVSVIESPFRGLHPCNPCKYMDFWDFPVFALRFAINREALLLGRFKLDQSLVASNWRNLAFIDKITSMSPLTVNMKLICRWKITGPCIDKSAR